MDVGREARLRIALGLNVAIVVAQDEKLPDTNIFYARIDTTNSSNVKK